MGRRWFAKSSRDLPFAQVADSAARRASREVRGLLK